MDAPTISYIENLNTYIRSRPKLWNFNSQTNNWIELRSSEGYPNIRIDYPGRPAPYISYYIYIGGNDWEISQESLYLSIILKVIKKASKFIIIVSKEECNSLLCSLVEASPGIILQTISTQLYIIIPGIHYNTANTTDSEIYQSIIYAKTLFNNQPRIGEAPLIPNRKRKNPE